MAQVDKPMIVRWLRYHHRLFGDLLDGHPRGHSLPVRMAVGGRDPIAHRYANEWTWRHPIRMLGRRVVLRRRHKDWREQWGGDPIARRLALGESRRVACARALTANNPRIHLIRQELDLEVPR